MNIESVRESLAQAPRIVEGLIAAAPHEALTWREADGAWNIVEVLCHIADGEITDWMPRVERILSGGGRFMPYDREGGFTRYRGWTAEALVGEFGQLRRANLLAVRIFECGLAALCARGGGESEQDDRAGNNESHDNLPKAVDIGVARTLVPRAGHSN